MNVLEVFAVFGGLFLFFFLVWLLAKHLIKKEKELEKLEKERERWKSKNETSREVIEMLNQSKMIDDSEKQK